MSQLRYRLKLRLPPGHDDRSQFLGFSLGFGHALVEGGPWCARPFVRRFLANISEPRPLVFTEYSDAEFRAELAIDAWDTLSEGNEDWKEHKAEYPNGIQDVMMHLAGHDGYEIERWDAEADRWVPISLWRLDELRRAEDQARASAQLGAAATEGTAPTPAERRATLAESDAGLLVACLADCDHDDGPYTPKRIVRVLELANLRRKTAPRILRFKGRKRLRERYGGACPFHPPTPNLAVALQLESDEYKKKNPR